MPVVTRGRARSSRAVPVAGDGAPEARSGYRRRATGGDPGVRRRREARGGGVPLAGDGAPEERSVYRRRATGGDAGVRRRRQARGGGVPVAGDVAPGARSAYRRRATGGDPGVRRRREARGGGVPVAGDGAPEARGGEVGSLMAGVDRGGRRRVVYLPLVIPEIAGFLYLLYGPGFLIIHDYDLTLQSVMVEPLPDFGSLSPPPRQRPPFAGQFCCQICSQCYLDREPTAVPQCGHIFCAECIRREREARCPQCLEEYEPSSLTRIYIN